MNAASSCEMYGLYGLVCLFAPLPLQSGEGGPIADAFDEVTILWTDLKGFTQFSSQRPPMEVVSVEGWEGGLYVNCIDVDSGSYIVLALSYVDPLLCAGGLPERYVFYFRPHP